MPDVAAVVLALAALGFGLTIADLTGRLTRLRPMSTALGLPAIVNAPLSAGLVVGSIGGEWVWTLLLFALPLAYLWVRLNFFGVRDGIRTGIRLKLLGGAAPVLLALGYVIVVELVVLPLSFVGRVADTAVLVTNAVWALIACLVLYLNGIVRALALSKSLTLLSRIVLLTAVWIPFFGWLLGIGAARQVRREYLAATDRIAWERATPIDRRCATQYPVLLVHGVGWRDYARFNSFGRIPLYLKRHGARVFHAEQEAWGGIDSNAEQVARRIDQVLTETGAAKVNLIAHSRGGIDARHAISACGVGDRVASLTTMNTPHHGVRFADSADHLAEPIHLWLASVVNRIFTIAGDVTPDFFSSIRAFRTAQSREFNAANPDHPGVYYQSWTSVMSSAGSDRLLAPTYLLIKALGEDNDGLVAVDSARWGEFRGTLRSSSRRGIGHGDLVDMHREDFAGFNVLAFYIDVVAELRERGF